MATAIYKGSTQIANVIQSDDYASNIGLGNVDYQEWVRPTEWLTLPTLGPTDKKLVGLVAVTNDDGNFLALRCSGSLGYTVDWGDGTVENIATNVQANHKYTFSSISAGTEITRDGQTYRQVIVTITPQSTGTLTQVLLQIKHSQSGLVSGYVSKWLDIAINGPNITFFNLGSSSNPSTRLTMLERCVIGTLGNITTLAYLFGWCVKLQKFVIGTSTTNVTDFTNMFYNCNSLQQVPFFDTSNGTTVNSMFSNCYSLLSIPKYDMRKSTSFANTFYYCMSLRTIPNILETSLAASANVGMNGMFMYCRNLQSIPKIDCSKANTTTNMFSQCHSLIEIPALNISNTTTTASMFESCGSLTKVPFLDISKSTACSYMFAQCYFLKSIPYLNTENSTTFNQMFQGCSSLTTIPKLNTSKGTSFHYMFNACYNLKIVPQLDMSSAQRVEGMFSNCLSIKKIPTLNIDPTKLISDPTAIYGFADFFFNCTSLEEVPYIDTSTSKTFYRMFSNCSSLRSIPSLNTSQGVNFSNMLAYCYALRSVPSLNTANGTNFQSMFQGCSNLETLPLLNTANGTNFLSMLNACSSLTTIPALNMSASTNSATAFSDCNSLANCDVTGNRYTTSVANGCLSRDALVEMFTNLGTAAGAQTFTYTNNYGASSLSAADKLIATSKGWTLSPA